VLVDGRRAGLKVERDPAVEKAATPGRARQQGHREQDRDPAAA
jgi:hypothetical protein